MACDKGTENGNNGHRVEEFLHKVSQSIIKNLRFFYDLLRKPSVKTEGFCNFVQIVVESMEIS